MNSIASQFAVLNVLTPIWVIKTLDKCSLTGYSRGSEKDNSNPDADDDELDEAYYEWLSEGTPSTGNN